MFERYTEKARRAVFFARYEASQFGSEFITPEHLLLGILRDDKQLIRQVLPNVEFESVRLAIEKRAKPSDVRVPVSVDLPLSEDSKLVLKYGMEEADLLNSRHIGTEHLLLALMRDKEFLSAKILTQFGASLESLRKRVEVLPPRTDHAVSPQLRQRVLDSVREYRRTLLTPLTVEIHGKKRNLE
jgi:ATP-dependent Clp protease ATP-binding subunit ClpC